MLRIIHASEFTVIPWKNGLGKTVEMAISDGGTLDNFDWRISQATVANNGNFSDFSGLERNLVLIKGNGISLTHKHSPTANTPCQEEHLNTLLDYACFDGGYHTDGTLHDGEIVDLNIMTDSNKFDTQIVTAKQCESLTLPSADLVFIYSLSDGLVIDENAKLQPVENGALVSLIDTKPQQYKVSGSQIIIAIINHR